MSDKHEIPRLTSILDGDFAKSLGSPTDFEGHRRLMFSLDNAQSNIVNDKTLPKIVNLIEDIIQMKFEFQISKGGYQHDDGTFVIEVSFLVKIDSPKLFAELKTYLMENTRQESVLIIDENNDAQICNLRKLNRAYKVAGKWKQVDKDVALKSPVGFTQIGNMWFVAIDPNAIQVDEKKLELLGHPITKAVHEYVYAHDDDIKREVSSDSITWTMNMNGLDAVMKLRIEEKVIEYVPIYVSMECKFGHYRGDKIPMKIIELISKELGKYLTQNGFKVERENNTWSFSIKFQSEVIHVVADTIVDHFSGVSGAAWDVIHLLIENGLSDFIPLATPPLPETLEEFLADRDPAHREEDTAFWEDFIKDGGRKAS